MMSDVWQSLPAIPDNLDKHKTRVGKPIRFSRNEYLLPIGEIDSLSTILLYNVTNNEYDTFMQFKKNMAVRLDSAAIDIENQMIYIAGHAGILQIDLTTKTTRFVSKKRFKYSLSTIITNDKLYIFHFPIAEDRDDDFGSLAAHTIYDIKTSKVRTTTIFFPKPAQYTEFAEGEQMVFLESENKCLFIGGDLSTNIVIYDITNDDWSIMKGVRSSDLELYGDQSIVITNDDRFVIIFNSNESDLSIEDNDGSGGMEYVNEIEIIDLKTKSCTKSSVKLPSSWQDEPSHAFIADDYSKSDIIINGYLRQCWKDKIFINLDQLPLELIRVIIEFHSQDVVHIMQRSTGHQWTISLQEILSSTA